jgi:hypothetical protein
VLVLNSSTAGSTVVGADVVRRSYAGSPGSGGASPYLVAQRTPGHCPSPSVTSVTSVRCFPLACVSRPGATASPKEHPATAHPPLRLRDLCAMLSPCVCFLPRCHGVAQRTPGHCPSPSVTSVRCFRLSRDSRPGSHSLHPQRRAESGPRIFLIVAEKRCRFCSRRTTSSSVTQLS